MKTVLVEMNWSQHDEYMTMIKRAIERLYEIYKDVKNKESAIEHQKQLFDRWKMLNNPVEGTLHGHTQYYDIRELKEIEKYLL